MSPIVLDSAALVELLLATPKGVAIHDRMTGPDIVRHIPDLSPVEVASALRGLVVGGKVPAARAADALADLRAVAAVRHRTEPLLPRVWELRRNLTVYDATYVALAEALDAPLVTTDRKFDTPTVTRLIDVDVVS